MRWGVPIAALIAIPFIAGVFIPDALKAARQRHRIICRDAFRLLALSEFVWAGAFMWFLASLFSGSVVGRLTFVLFTYGANALADLGARRRGQKAECWLGHIWQARAHRDHEDDCEYGPKHHRGRARLRSWRKVAIRPAFAPT